MAQVVVRRIHEEPSESDGRRVLVDRLWPRGIRKADAALDDHLVEVAPSGELRRWYGRDPQRFAEFRRRYLAELDRPPAAEHLAALVGCAREQRVTLLTATKDVERSHAAVLAERIREQLGEGRTG